MDEPRNTVRKASREAAVGLSIVAFVLVLYLTTLSGHYSADGLLYALRIEGGQLQDILDPTHVLIEPAGYGWYQLWQDLGYGGGSLMPLQTLNAVAGAVSVGVFYAIGFGLTGSRRVAGVTSLGFAVSGGMWLLSVEAEFVTLPLAAALAVLWLVLTPPDRLARRRIVYAATLGAALALAVLLYLDSVILITVAAAGLITQERRTRREWTRQLFVMLAVVGIVCLPAAAILLSRHSWAEWRHLIWQDGGSGYTAFRLLDGPHGVYAFLRTLGLFPGLALSESAAALLSEAGWGRRLTFGAYYVVLFLVGLIPFVAAIRIRYRLWARYRRALTLLGLWSVLYGAFAIYWVPGDMSFWVPVLAAWWFLAGLVLVICREGQEAEGRPRPVKRYLEGGNALLLLAIALAVLNATMVIWPRRDLATNRSYQLARKVKSQTSNDDLIITESIDLGALHIVYFGRRTVLPVAGMLTELVSLAEPSSPNDFNSPNGSNAPSESRAVSRHIEAILEETRAGGGRAYVLQGEDLVFLRP